MVAATEKRNNLAAYQVMIGAIAISFSGVYVKWVQVGPTVSGFYRVLIGGAVLTVIALIRKEAFWKSSRYFFLQFFCGFVFALDLFCWHQSVLFIGPGLSTILGNFQVFFLAFIGVLVLGEQVSIKLVLTIPLAFFGLFLVVGLRWELLSADYRAGVILGLLTAVCYSGYILTLRKLQSGSHCLPPMSNLAMVSLSTAFVLAIFVVFEGERIALPDVKTSAVLTGYAVFSQVLGWVLISRGLPGIQASLAGLLLLLQPSLAFVWDMLFFGLAVTPRSGIGILMTLVAIYMGSTRQISLKRHWAKSNKR